MEGGLARAPPTASLDPPHGGRDPSAPPLRCLLACKGDSPRLPRLSQRAGHKSHALARVGQPLALTNPSSTWAPLIRTPQPAPVDTACASAGKLPCARTASPRGGADAHRAIRTHGSTWVIATHHTHARRAHDGVRLRGNFHARARRPRWGPDAPCEPRASAEISTTCTVRGCAPLHAVRISSCARRAQRKTFMRI